MLLCVNFEVQFKWNQLFHIYMCVCVYYIFLHTLCVFILFVCFFFHSSSSSSSSSSFDLLFWYAYYLHTHAWLMTRVYNFDFSVKKNPKKKKNYAKSKIKWGKKLTKNWMQFIFNFFITLSTVIMIIPPRSTISRTTEYKITNL